MSVNKIKANTLVPFAAIPNDFLRNPKISIGAKGTGAYLQSLSDGFEIHPKYIQKILGYGERVWRRIAKELISYGCLKLVKGGKEKGSWYVFSFYNYHKPAMPLCDIGSDTKKSPKKCKSKKAETFKMSLSEKATRSKSDSDKTYASNTKKYKTTKKYINNNKQDLPKLEVVTDSEDPVVVCFINKMLVEIPNLDDRVAYRWIRVYGLAMVQEKFEMMLTANSKNRAAWMNSALIKNYRRPLQIVPRETLEPPKYYERLENQQWFLALTRLEREKICSTAKERFLVLEHILKKDNLDPTSDEFINHHTFDNVMYYCGRRTFEKQASGGL